MEIMQNTCTQVFLRWLGKPRPRYRETGLFLEQIGYYRLDSLTPLWVFRESPRWHRKWSIDQAERLVQHSTRNHATLFAIDRQGVNEYLLPFDESLARSVDWLTLFNIMLYFQRAHHRRLKCSDPDCGQQIVRIRTDVVDQTLYEFAYCRIGHLMPAELCEKI